MATPANIRFLTPKDHQTSTFWVSAECFSSAEANQAKDRHSRVDSSEHSDSLAPDLEAEEHSDQAEEPPGIQAQRFPQWQAQHSERSPMAPQRPPIFCLR